MSIPIDVYTPLHTTYIPDEGVIKHVIRKYERHEARELQERRQQEKQAEQEKQAKELDPFVWIKQKEIKKVAKILREINVQ